MSALSFQDISTHDAVIYEYQTIVSLGLLFDFCSDIVR
jgi:hypothetical protein